MPPLVRRPIRISSRGVSPALIRSCRFWKAAYIAFQRACDTLSPFALKYITLHSDPDLQKKKQKTDSLPYGKIYPKHPEREPVCGSLDSQSSKLLDRL